MSFSFDVDYLEDLKPLLALLKEAGRSDTIEKTEDCKALGSTGGEILSCICGSLRTARKEGVNRPTENAVNEYLKKAGPGY